MRNDVLVHDIATMLSGTKRLQCYTARENCGQWVVNGESDLYDSEGQIVYTIRAMMDGWVFVLRHEDDHVVRIAPR